MKKLTALILAAAMLLSLAGCTATSGGNTEGKKTFTFSSGMEAFTLDPASNTEAFAAALFELLTPPLFYWVNGEAEAITVASYDVSEDDLVYTFHLKEGYTWEDGTPMTAYDYEYSAQRWADPETGAISGGTETDFILNGYELYQEMSLDDPTLLGVHALDDLTLQITLAQPCPYFITLLSRCMWLYPLKKDFVESCGADFAADADTFLSCGPYRLASWTHDAELVLEKREDFFEADRYEVDIITRLMIEDDSTATNMFENGEIDAIFDLDPKFLKNYPQARLCSSDQQAILWVNFDSPNQPELLQNDHFRMALSYALNREAIVNAVIGSNGTRAWTRPIGPNIPGVNKSYVEEYPLPVVPDTGDIEAAKTHLSQAMEELGYSDVSQLPSIEFATLEGSDYRTYAESIVDAWKQNLNLTNITIAQYPFGTLMGLQDDMKYDLCYWFQYTEIDAFVALRAVYSDGDYTGWDYSDVEKTSLASNGIEDMAERFSVIASQEQSVLEEGPFIPLWNNGTSLLLQDGISGLDDAARWMYLDRIHIEEQSATQ